MSAFLTPQRVAMDIRDQDVGIYRQFGLKGGISGGKKSTDRTCVEDLKDSDEVLFPRGDCIFIALGMKDPGGRISFALLGDLLLYCGDSSAFETQWVSRPRSVRVALVRLT